MHELSPARPGHAVGGTPVAVNLLSCPGGGSTALLELLLAGCVGRGVRAAALTGDLVTQDGARRPAGDHLGGRLPAGTRLLFVENVGDLGRPAGLDLGESLRVVLASVTEGEDTPERYPTAYRRADLVVVTKADLATACAFDEQAFLDSVTGVRPGVEVIATSARTGQGVDVLLDRVLELAAILDVPVPAVPSSGRN